MKKDATAEEVLGILGWEYSQQGSRLQFICPNPDHADTKPSAFAFDDGGWKCFGCDAGGDILNLYATAMGQERDKAERDLARLMGHPLPPVELPDPQMGSKIRARGEARLQELRTKVTLLVHAYWGERLDTIAWAWIKGRMTQAEAEGALKKFMRETGVILRS